MAQILGADGNAINLEALERTEEVRMLKSLSATQKREYVEFWEFLVDIATGKTSQWIAEMFINSLWTFDIEIGALAIRYWHGLESQMRDQIVSEVMDALETTPNKFITLERKH